MRQAGDDVPVAVHALFLDAPVCQCSEQGTAGFAVMFAVTEAAVPEQRAELDKAFLDGLSADMAEAKLASQAALRGYQVLKAPFDGVVTARFADPGALVQKIFEYLPS